MTKLCDFDGCVKQARRGVERWCASHTSQYYVAGKDESALKPLRVAPHAAGQGEAWAFVVRASKYVGEDCLLWPFSGVTGYGRVRVPGERRKVMASRAVLELAVGPPPSAEARLALHDPLRCTSRACVNPAHLRWGSFEENAADRWFEGTMPFGEDHHAAKISDAELAGILHGSERLVSIARRIGVHPTYLAALRSGRTKRVLSSR